MRPLPTSRSRTLMTLCAASASSMLLFAAGCASPSSSASGTAGVTHAMLLIAATNDAKIPIFKFNVQGVTLVSSSGTPVPLLTTPQLVELGSISGVARPLVATDIPEGTYTSVQLTYGPSTFVVIDRSGGAGTIEVGNYDIATKANQPVTVNLPLSTPLLIKGTAMGLLLDLNIPQSTTFTPYLAGSSNPAPGGGQTTFNPVFSFLGISPAASPATLQDGKVEDVHGQVTANSAGALTIAADSGTTLNFTTSSSTIFAGANGAAPSPVNSFVDLDAALQPDGSLLATRVQTESTSQQYNIVGQIVQYTQQLYLENMGREQQGPNLPNGTGFYSNNAQLDPSSQFEIAWPNGTVPAGLPFTPSLNAGSILPGQNLANPVDALQTSGNNIPVTNIVTLEPQTIDATVVAASSVNGQTSYQVDLFPDDLITLFGPGQQVVVYVTAATHTIATSTLTTGSVARFRAFSSMMEARFAWSRQRSRTASPVLRFTDRFER